MVKSQKNSSLDDMIESSGVREKTRHAKVVLPGGGSLPPGINRGIAKLTKIDFDIIKAGDYKGKPRFYSHGVCVEPKEHEGTPIEGRLVQLGIIKMCPTKGQDGTEVSFEENYTKAENRLKALGFPTEDFDRLTKESLEYFEENKDDMYFEFSTWQPADSDRILVVLRGAAKYEPSDDDEDMEDDTPPPPKKSSKPKTKVVAVEEEEEEEEVVKPTKKSSAAKNKAKVVKEEEEEEEEEEESPISKLEAMCKKSMSGDTKAQLLFTKEAEKYDVDASEDIYEDWDSVLEAIKKAIAKSAKKTKKVEAVEEEEEEEEEEEAAELVPTKGHIYGYTPPKSKKVKECKVTKVLVRAKTVDLKSVLDDVEYTAVAWSKLSEVETEEEDE